MFSSRELEKVSLLRQSRTTGIDGKRLEIEDYDLFILLCPLGEPICFSRYGDFLGDKAYGNCQSVLWV